MTGGRSHSGTFHLASSMLGFALGGFFDGILLHQILQWHHLLSLVAGVGDLRSQVFMDGLFHAGMYVVAAAGLFLLWRNRGELAGAAAGRILLGGVLIGFGGWHVLDGVLSHWVLGIHRIKLDSANPLAWDLLWFAVFGLVPLALGLRMRGGGGGPRGRSAAVVLAIAILGSGTWAARSPADSDTAVVVFRPGVTDGQVLNAIQAAGGRLLWQSRGVWAVQWPERVASAPLYGGGALLVSSSLLGAGCLAWSQV